MPILANYNTEIKKDIDSIQLDVWQPFKSPALMLPITAY
jgi:hypothetical protein